MTSAIFPVKHPIFAQLPFSELVVPPDVSAYAFDYTLNGGPANVQQFADRYVLYEVNRLSKAGQMERVAVKRGGRAIHMVLLSSPLLASAPATVQSLATGLTVKDQSFVVWAQATGDVWLVAGRTEGLRHAMFDWMYRIGIKYIGPHSSWVTRPSSLVGVDCADLMRSATNDLFFAPNGGVNGHGISFSGPLQDAQVLAGKAWYDWYQQACLPTEAHAFVGGDGGIDVTYYHQNEFAADHTMLAWNATNGIRGTSTLSGTLGFPNYCFPQDAILSKVCVNHHGTVNAGPSFPARPGTATPWVGFSVPALACTITSPHFLTKPNSLTFSGNTCTRTTGSWITDGFTATDKITFFNTASNNVVVQVSAVTATVVTITGTFVSETSTTVTATGKTNRNTGTNDPGPDTGTPPAPLDYTSFDGMAKIYCLHARDVACGLINANPDPNGPFTRWISVSPADGPFQCECVKCRDMLRYKYGVDKDSTVSDLCFDLANQTQAYLDYFFGTSTTVKPGVSISAYADHSDLPSFPIKPGVCVTLLPQTIPGSTNVPANLVINNWSTFANSNPLGKFELGLQCTWQIATQRDIIAMSARDALEQFNRFISIGFTRGFSTQCSASNFSCGPMQYGMARLAWRPSLSIETLLTEWFAPLGAAATQVKATFERMWDWFEIIPHEIGQLFLDMQVAQTALSADPAATADQQTCLNHVKAYVQWVRLYYEFQLKNNAWLTAGLPTTGTALSDLLTAIDNATLHAWNMSLSMNAIQADLHAGENLYASIPATGTGTATLKAKWLKSDAAASGFASVAEPTTSGLTTMVTAGVAAYPLVSGVTRRSFGYNLYRHTSSTLPKFTGTLVPFTTTSSTTMINTVNWCDRYQTYRFKKGVADITFNLVAAKFVASVKPTYIRIINDAGVEMQRFTYSPTSTAYYDTVPLTITVPPGGYTLEFNDDIYNGTLQHLSWPKNVPFVQLYPSQIQGFAQSVKLYFYVPLGETRIVMAFNNYPYGPCNFYDPSGTLVSATTDGLGQYTVTVPSGKSGDCWSFDHIQSSAGVTFPYLVNCPALFSFSREQMMIPAGLDGF